jgi:hypothetical protein
MDSVNDEERITGGAAFASHHAPPEGFMVKAELMPRCARCVAAPRYFRRRRAKESARENLDTGDVGLGYLASAPPPKAAMRFTRNNIRNLSRGINHSLMTLGLRARFWQCNTFPASPALALLLGLSFNEVGGTNVNLALKLNVLAVCAVFLFVGAILFGAF